LKGVTVLSTEHGSRKVEWQQEGKVKCGERTDVKMGSWLRAEGVKCVNCNGGKGAYFTLEKIV
jgi:hypothetical protein